MPIRLSRIWRDILKNLLDLQMLNSGVDERLALLPKRQHKPLHEWLRQWIQQEAAEVGAKK